MTITINPVAVADKNVARRRVWTASSYVAALVVAAIVIVPILFVVLGGFRTTGQIANKPFGFPAPWVPSNYSDVATAGAFFRQLFNSAVIAGGTTFATVFFGSLAAFALSRYSFRGREVLYNYFSIGLLFPAAVAVLPLYVMLRNLHLLDNPWIVAGVQTGFSLPVTIVILRPFMRNVPAELEDAAVMDGSSRWGFYWRIMVPLSKPALITVGVLAFIGSWNSYLLPLLLFDNPAHYTLPLGTASFTSDHAEDTAKILAFTALSMLPALGLFIAAERRLVGGLSGAVKG